MTLPKVGLHDVDNVLSVVLPPQLGDEPVGEPAEAHVVQLLTDTHADNVPGKETVHNVSFLKKIFT